MEFEQNLLAIFGDPLEQEGLELALGPKFPRYAEFWLYYVYPNRRTGNSSKLRETFPVEIENICNAHYAVWYHLTIAFRQLNSIENLLVEVGDLLFHLATVIDLVELVFVLALKVQARLQGKPIVTELTKEAYDQIVANFWASEYAKGFRKFDENHKPVNITLHNNTKLFQDRMPRSDGYRAFVRIANTIRPYRNQLAHNIPPMNVVTSETVRMIPKPEYIQMYAGGRFSSVEPDLQHFAPAGEILEGQASGLTEAVNDLWETLLRIMTGIANSPQYEHLIVPFEMGSGESGVIEEKMIRPSQVKYPPYTGGTIDFMASKENDLPYDGE